MMQTNRSSKLSDPGFAPGGLLLSVGLPLLLVLAFLGTQFVHFDSAGWSNGFNHPWLGWDHLVTMLAVGIWAAQLRGQAVWMLPLAFVGVMSLGGLAGAAGFAIPSVEGIILLSGAVFSVLITRKVRFSAQINVLIVAFFAFFHGFAHGQEISASASLISYTLGFMLATLLLHGAGILIAKLVVLGIACLLTVMFSNAALAKNAESIVGEKVKAIAVAQEADLNEIAPFWIARDSAGQAIAGWKTRADDGGGLGGGDAIGSAASDQQANARADRIENDSAKLTADSHGAGPVSKQTAVQALDCWPNSGVLNPVYSIASGLDFKHYYPDINHTPGKRLLSNGVGLNSPPASVPHVLAPQVFPHFRKSPISSIEDPFLRLTLAEFDFGDLSSQTPAPLGQPYPSRNRCDAAQGTVASARCRTISLCNLTPVALPHRQTMGVVSGLQFFPASRKNLPSDMPAIWFVKAVPIQHNNKNQRDTIL